MERPVLFTSKVRKAAVCGGTPLKPPILETTGQAVQVIHDADQGTI